jgi:hypothetical protein
MFGSGDSLAHLHRHLSIVDQDLSSQEIGADGGLVARTEFLVDLDEKTSTLVRGHDRGSREKQRIHIDSLNLSFRHHCHQG